MSEYIELLTDSERRVLVAAFDAIFITAARENISLAGWDEGSTASGEAIAKWIVASRNS